MSSSAPRHVTRLTPALTGAAGPDRRPSIRPGSPAGRRAECDGADSDCAPAAPAGRTCRATQAGPARPSRRRFLVGAGALAAGLGLSACSDVHSMSASSGAGMPQGPTGQPGVKVAGLSGLTGNLTFAFWGGTTGEEKGFAFAKRRFEELYLGATVTLQKLPFDGFFAGIDRGLQAGKAPDVFRVDYTNVGKYAAGGVLLDLTPYFTSAEVGQFVPALWKAITFRDVPYGIPHQTDVTALIYDRAALSAAGVTPPSPDLDRAWTWDQFFAAAARLRRSLPSQRYPFAYNWTKAGAYRWFSWLYQAGGRVTNPEATAAALNSDAAVKALTTTTGFFTQGWVPASNTVKTATYTDDFFLQGSTAMSFVGSFTVPTITDPAKGYRGDWGVAPMPRDVAAATDLGGNAIVANRESEHPDLAAAFLRVLASEECMRYFCEQSIELPTRTKLQTAKLDYAIAPEKVETFAQQATTLNDVITTECSHPGFNKINTALQDRLEASFTAAGDPRATLDALTADVDAVLR